MEHDPAGSRPRESENGATLGSSPRAGLFRIMLVWTDGGCAPALAMTKVRTRRSRPSSKHVGIHAPEFICRRRAQRRRPVPSPGAADGTPIGRRGPRRRTTRSLSGSESSLRAPCAPERPREGTEGPRPLTRRSMVRTTAFFAFEPKTPSASEREIQHWLFICIRGRCRSLPTAAESFLPAKVPQPGPFSGQDCNRCFSFSGRFSRCWPRLQS
jgi:hypothetical protein